MHRQPLNPYNTFEMRMIDFEGNIGEKESDSGMPDPPNGLWPQI